MLSSLFINENQIILANNHENKNDNIHKNEVLEIRLPDEY